MSKVDYHKIVRSPEPKSTNTEFKELENYRIEHTIDEGTFGKVKLGIHLPTKEKVAIKVLEKSKIIDSDDSERIYREISFLKKLKHGNIIKLYEIIENSKNYYLIMEYAAGGELFNYIVRKKHLDDQDASYFFTQIINGLEYIHKNSIVHRDLKPENLLLTKDRVLKIIDFGLSNSYKPGQLLHTPCGSPCYASPEMILGKKYSGLSIDIWSIGIILYAMVCGYLPFEDKNNDKLYKKILEGKLEFPDYISEISKDLIIKFLNTNPKKRIKLEEIKSHPFYKMGEKQLKKEEAGLFDNERLNEIVLETMSEQGFSKEEALRNLNAKKHNNITTTYTLFFHKYKVNPVLCENFIKNHENLFKKSSFVDIQSGNTNNPNNINININTQNHFGNININILDSTKNLKNCNSQKSDNKFEQKRTHTEKTPIDSANTTKLEDKKDVILTPSKKENSINEEEKSLTLDPINNPNNINVISNNPNLSLNNSGEKKKNEQIVSPKRVKDLIIETTVYMKTKLKTNNIINNKFNTSMSYEETLNRSLNENNNQKYKAASPSERVNRDKNLFNLKKNQISKTFNKNIPNSPKKKYIYHNLSEIGSTKGDNKNSADLRTTMKNNNQMAVIMEENENHNNQNNIRSIKVDISNNTNRKAKETNVITGIITNPVKIENVEIDFKKKLKNLSIVDFNKADANTRTSKKNNNDFKSPQHKAQMKEETIQTKRLNSQTKAKEKINYLQCSPVHRSIQNSIDQQGNSPAHSKQNQTTIDVNLKNKNSTKLAQSPERISATTTSNLLDNMTKNNNLTTISHGERNNVPRLISPIVNIGNFNNTTNSLKEGQSNNININNNNLNASPNHSNIEKFLNDKNSSNKNAKNINNTTKLNTRQTMGNTVKKNNDISSMKKINNTNTSTTISTNITPSQMKKPSSNIPIVIDLKKEKNTLNTITLTESNEKKNAGKQTICVEKKNDKKNSITNYPEKEKKGDINDLAKTNTFMQKLPEKLSSEKINIERNRKDTASSIKKPSSQYLNTQNKSKNSLKSDKDISGDNEIENLLQKKQTDFACCTINDINEIQVKLSKYCEENNVSFKDVDNMKYECTSETFTVGLEFSNVKNMKFLKIYQVSGNEQPAKELMKSFLNLVL